MATRIKTGARLLFEIVEALIPILGADRIGVRLSPLGKMNDISDDNPESTFGYNAERPSDYGLSYLHIVNPALEQMQRGEPEPGALNVVSLDPKRISGNLDCGGWLRRRERSALASRRLGRPSSRSAANLSQTPICPCGCASTHR